MATILLFLKNIFKKKKKTLKYDEDFSFTSCVCFDNVWGDIIKSLILKSIVQVFMSANLCSY